MLGYNCRFFLLFQILNFKDMNITQKIAEELTVHTHQIESAIRLLDDGATVPFIARYRKEVTGGLDDTQLRFLSEHLQYLREL